MSYPLSSRCVAKFGLTRLQQGFLYRISPIDPAAFAVAVLIPVMAMLVAAVRPAARATYFDPMASMRN